MNKLPNSSDLLIPLLTALRNSGGKLNHKDIEVSVVDLLQIPDTLRRQVHSGGRTELNYRLSWARTKAKSLGYLEKQDGGIWSLTTTGENFLSN